METVEEKTPAPRADIIARVEAGAEGPDTRFIVTNLNKKNARVLYEEVYCRRGQAENHIKSFKTHLAADRTLCTKATANQLRLFLHAGAYWLARVDAETFDVARRPVRYAAPAPHQDRRPRRRDEDDDPSALADLLPRAGYSALRSRTHTAPRHLTGGARAPRTPKSCRCRGKGLNLCRHSVFLGKPHRGHYRLLVNVQSSAT